LLTARRDRFASLLLEAQHQFPGGGVFGGPGFGFGIPIFGSGGFAAGTLGSPAAGAIGPVLTLESEFGVGFTSKSIADAILVAEQEGRFSQGSPTIEIATGPSLTLVLNVARGLFELFNTSGQKVGGGVTPEAAIEAARAGSIRPEEVAAPEPPTFPIPALAAPTAPFVAPPAAPQQAPNLFGAIQALISILQPGREPSPAFPPIPAATEAVLPGGSVNVPVVLGSTGDPTGIRRPTFPNEEQLSRAQQIGQIISQLLALRKARQNADKQRRAFEQFLAARLELLRGGQQMPFGQAGFVGPLGGGAIGALTDLAISAGGAFLADRFGGGTALQQFPQLPQVPGIPGLQGGGAFGGGGACPPLFRTGAPAGFSMRPVPWFPVQAPNGKWFFFGHLGTPTFSRLKPRRRHHHHARKR